jgi:hypothetical protein
MSYTYNLELESGNEAVLVFKDGNKLFSISTFSDTVGIDFNGNSLNILPDFCIIVRKGISRGIGFYVDHRKYKPEFQIFHDLCVKSCEFYGRIAAIEWLHVMNDNINNFILKLIECYDEPDIPSAIKSVAFFD